jgi:CHAT domain-containing protein/Tfp pilus assembly protein PilF
MQSYLKIIILFFTLLSITTSLNAQDSDWKRLYDSSAYFYQKGKYVDAVEYAKKSIEANLKAYSKVNPHLVTIFNKLAEINIKSSKYSDAEKYCDSALKITKSLVPVDSLNLAISLNILTEIYYNRYKYPEADSVGKISLGIKERLLGKTDPEIARSLNNLGEVNRRRGNFVESERLFKMALLIREKSLGADNYETGQSYNNLAILYYSQGKYNDAEELYKKALSIRRQTLGEKHSDVGVTLNNLAVLYNASGKYEQAEEYARKAIEVRESVFGPLHTSVATSLSNLAQSQAKQGKYGEAEQNYKRALAINEKSLGTFHPIVASTLNALAGLYYNVGKYCDAEPMYLKSLEIREKTLGPNHPEVVLSLINIGELYIQQNKYSKAEVELSRALEIYEKVLGPEHPEVARLINNLAFLYDEQKKYQESEQLYKRAISIQEKALGKEHPSTATTMNNLASLYYRQNRLQEAEPLYKQALVLREKLLGQYHPAVLTSLHSLACLYVVQKRYRDADSLFDKDLSIINRHFEQLFDYSSEQDKIQFLDMMYNYFPEYFTFATEYSTINPLMSGKILNHLLWQKGIVVSSTSELIRDIINSGDDGAIKLLDELKLKRESMAKLNSTIPKDYDEYRAEMDRLEKESNSIEEELSSKSSVFKKQKILQRVKWNDIQKRLTVDEAAIEFVSFRHWKKDDPDTIFYYYAIIVNKDTKDHPELVLLGTEKELQDLININYWLSISQIPFRKTLKPGNKQYAFIWKPLEKYLNGVRKIYLSPDGILNQFSFGVLVDEEGKFLIEKYELRYVSSIKDILRESEVKSQNKTALLIGNPKYLFDTVKTQIQKENLTTPLALRDSPSPYSELSPLPELIGTEVEVKAIANILKAKNWKAQSFLGYAATEEAVKKTRSPRVLHLATHGFFLTLSDFEQAELFDTSKCKGPAVKTNPMYRSGLFFAGADNKEKSVLNDDGIFTAYEATNLDLSGTELVILSACQTGLGDIKTGEGVFGLRRAFQIAGAEAIVMSLWSVPDKETEELMVIFYKKWLGGKDKYMAMREAQNEMREIVKKRYGNDNPFYWGAFVMVGR